MKNLLYDAPVLKEFRDVRVGTFRADSTQAPFHYDPRDATRIWFRHPDTGRIHEIPWKAAHLLQVPMGEWIRDRALRNVQARGGNKVLTHNSAALEIIDELGSLWNPEPANKATKKQRTSLYAERLRFAQAQRDHDDAAQIRRSEPGPRDPMPMAAGAESEWLDEVWPDY